MRIVYTILCLLVSQLAVLAGTEILATDSLQALDINYKFVDGVYTSVAALKTNEPTYRLANISGALVLQEEEYVLKVERLHPSGRADLPLDLSDFKVICVNGIPYIQAYEEEERRYTVYAGLRVRGRLCYFAYEKTYPDTVLIRAYNPLNGRPFRQQNIVRDQPQLHEKVLDFSSGEIYDFNLQNMLLLLETDKPLLSSLANMTENEAQSRLQKCLLIFDDRHPFYLPVAPVEK